MTEIRQVRIKKQIIRVALGLWLFLNLIVHALLRLSHGQLPLSPPPDGPARGKWSALHILAVQCPCSQRVLTHLENRGVLPEWSETVALVDGAAELVGLLQARGFEVTRLPSNELEDFCGVVLLPLLIVRDPNGNIRYAGACTTGPQLPLQGDAILVQVRSGRPVVRLANPGCEVSRGFLFRPARD